MFHRTQTHDHRFSRGWTALWLTDLFILAVGLVLIWRYRNPERALLWTIKVAAVMVFQQLLLLDRRKKILRGANLDHLWGTANIISLSRGTMIALLAGFVFTPKQPGLPGWLPAGLYTVSVVFDFLDGYWARKTATRTVLGELLDREYDALGVLVALVLAVQWGHLPLVFLTIGVAKYLFDLGISLRKLRGKAVRILPPSYMRRRLAGFQMGILAVLLCPLAQPPAAVLAEVIIGVPLLLGFIRDWLLVCGRLDPLNPDYLKIKNFFYKIGGRWLPLAVRVVLAAAAAVTLVRTIHPDAIALSWLGANALFLFGIYSALRLLLLLPLVAGRFTSISALLLLLLEGLKIFLSKLDLWGVLIVSGALLLYLFGAGPYRLFLHHQERPRGTLAV